VAELGFDLHHGVAAPAGASRSRSMLMPYPHEGIFLFAATLAIPLFWALLRIRGADIHFGRSCGVPDHHATKPNRASRRTLFKDVRRLGISLDAG